MRKIADIHTELSQITYEDILNNIKSIIAEKGMKQIFVAEKAGFSKQEFSNILHGRKLLRVEYIPRIAMALDVEIKVLFEKNCPTS